MSTVQNIIRAGQESAADSAQLYKDTRENSVRYDNIQIQNMRARADLHTAAWKADAKIKNAKTDRDTEVKKTGIEINTAKKVAGEKKKQRMAGSLAAAGSKLAAYTYLKNKKDRPDKYLEAHKEYISKLEGKLANYGSNGPGAAEQELQRQIDALSGKPPTTISSGVTVGTGTATGTGTGASSQLTGARKEFADAIAGPESGSWGYDAFNQGGAKGGTEVLGKSGSHKEVFGTSLTDMTLGQIFARQNGPKETHYQDGGLHAVGRYQFIGSTLRDEVDKMGLSHDTKFTPEVQDQIFFSHAKRIGSISPWIGPSTKYSQEKQAHLNSLIPQL